MIRTLALTAATVLCLLTGVSSAMACDGAKEDNVTTASAETPAVPADAQLVTLRIEDASCGSCVLPIREQLTTLTGVIKVEGSEVDYKDVLVTFNGKITNDDLIAAVKKAGFKAVIKTPAADEKKNS